MGWKGRSGVAQRFKGTWIREDINAISFAFPFSFQRRSTVYVLQLCYL